MKRILIPTKGPGDWAALLADPELQWKCGRSAMCLAASWEAAAPGLPPEVGEALARSGDPELADLAAVVAIPEFTTSLPGGSTSSQTDLMVLARNSLGSTILAVEGKVTESFGPTLGKKRAEASPGQLKRLTYLHEQCGLSNALPDGIRYQLLHRTVAALLFAEEVHAQAAVLLVHSFDPDRSSFEDFSAYARELGAEPRFGGVARAVAFAPLPLYLGWVEGDIRFVAADIAATV